MSYQSPINVIYEDLPMKINEDFENHVIEVVHSYSVQVDKAELIRALSYDRNQYEKGFAEGRPEHVLISNKYSDYPVDGYYDKQNGILFTSFITSEEAIRRGYSWKPIASEKE